MTVPVVERPIEPEQDRAPAREPEQERALARERVSDRPATDHAPRSLWELSRSEFAEELATLRRTPAFWVSALAKITLAFFCASHFATRWFAPFLYGFVHERMSDPWAAFLARGEPMAFPYGPGMLLALVPSWLPALVFSFDPAGHLGLFLLRVPLLVADLAICILLMRWLRMHARDVVYAYWLNPIVIYATYVHGQLDLIPTALLCATLFLMFEGKTKAAGAVFGLALATKAHLLIALPFAVMYLFRRKKPAHAWAVFSGMTALVAGALYVLPLQSPAFRSMVLGSTESQKLWAVAVPFGARGLVLYLAPAAVLVAFMRFASYRKVNRELTLMFIGALYVALVALVPPQPGWFIWSIPFVAYLGARFTRAGRFALFALSATYLVYFFVGDPVVFLEAFDPVFGAGTGAVAAARLEGLVPALFGAHAASIAWTLLFSATTLAGFEMYRKGVRSNAIYSFRDESFMVGIGGDSGAGKHTLARDLLAVMGPQLSIINGDDDHKWERGHAMWRRYTHLDPRGNSLHAQLEGLAALRRGGDVRKRHYDHDAGRFTSPLVIKPTDFMAIVGLHPFYLASQRELLHLKIFVEPDEKLRRSWKIDRDTKKRGATEEQVVAEMDRRVADSQKYVRPQAKYADLVLRHTEIAGKGAVSLTVELSSSLEPLTLLSAFEALPGLTVSWTPDEELTRDRIEVSGTIDEAEVRALALVLLPNAEELLHGEHWSPGGRGLALVVVLHAVSVSLRGKYREAA